MTDGFEKMAGSFLGSGQGSRLAEKKGDIERLADSGDGRKVRELLEKSGAPAALESGDVGALRGALAEIMQTGEGVRLYEELSKLMK